MGVEDAFNYKEVSESISTAGLLSEQQVDALQSEGYNCVINLLPNDSEYALQSEKERIENQGIRYEYIPVEFNAPTEHDYVEFENTMKALKANKTMVHCAANYRVSAFYAIYARRNLGWSVSKAEKHIASIWNPAEYDPWESFIAHMLQPSNT